MRILSQRGTNDFYPGAKEPWLESAHWLWLESEFRAHTRLYGYQDLRTPILEDYQLFVRSSGETTDIVTKEMFDFMDRGERHVAMRPELTAPAIRSLLENNLCPQGTVSRLSYIGPIFRYERPQMGRYRQAHQMGFELVGSPSVSADAEAIEVSVRLYEKLGVKDVVASINNLGREACRDAFRAAIMDKAGAWLKDEPTEVQERVHKNPLRLLDSKDPAVQKIVETVPPVTDFLEPESRGRFEGLQEMLEIANVKFKIDTGVVRGLDYYTETVFEIHGASLGAQTALCGGGRYDNLIHELGGGKVPAVGVGMGMERCLIVLGAQGKFEEHRPSLDVFVAQVAVDVTFEARGFAAQLREAGISVQMDYEGKSLKSQMGQADKLGAKYAVIVGVDELARGALTLRLLSDSSQKDVPIDGLVEAIRAGL